MTRQEAMAAVRANPKDPQLWLELGAILAAEGEYSQARDCYEHALRLDPDSDEARVGLQLVTRSAPQPIVAPVVPRREHDDGLIGHLPEEPLVPTDTAGDEPPLIRSGAIQPPHSRAERDQASSDWLLGVRDRMEAEPVPRRGGRINIRRLIIALLVLTLVLVLLCSATVQILEWFQVL